MQLNYDWLGFERLFNRKPIRGSRGVKDATSTIDPGYLDSLVNESLKLTHCLEQKAFFRQKLLSDNPEARELLETQGEHFLIGMMGNRWASFLPGAYGVFIRIEPDKEKRSSRACDFFITARGGKIESFHTPDLSPMGAQRKLVAEEVVKYLSEKYLLPVQGVVMPAGIWDELSSETSSRKTWFRLLRLVHEKRHEKRVTLAPYRWKIAFLLAARAITPFR